MKSPGTASHKASGKKAKASGKPPGKFPSTGQLRRDYKGEARREDASARREEADARHRDAEAAHYRAEGEKAKAEGYKKEAEYDFAKARREDAEARRDMARARHDQAKARRDRRKAARVGLAVPGTRSGGWILGGNDRWETCAAVAVANSLLASCGLLCSDDEVWDLHLRGGGSVLGALEAASWGGVTGPRSKRIALPLSVTPGRPRQRSSLILELDLTEAQRDQSTWDWEPSPSWGPHAVLLAEGSVITWGREIPVTRAFLESQTVDAWHIEWGGVK